VSRRVAAVSVLAVILGYTRWPAAASRYRDTLPHADCTVLDDVGYCPRLDVPLETAELVLGLTVRPA
jgi:hypothetical protein